jgi:hypothetical protein
MFAPRTVEEISQQAVPVEVTHYRVLRSRGPLDVNSTNSRDGMPQLTPTAPAPQTMDTDLSIPGRVEEDKDEETATEGGDSIVAG